MEVKVLNQQRNHEENGIVYISVLLRCDTKNVEATIRYKDLPLLLPNGSHGEVQILSVVSDLYLTKKEYLAVIEELENLPKENYDTEFQDLYSDSLDSEYALN